MAINFISTEDACIEWRELADWHPTCGETFYSQSGVPVLVLAGGLAVSLAISSTWKPTPFSKFLNNYRRCDLDITVRRK